MPATSTEVALATTTLSSAAATITFSSISGSYTDLRIVITGTTSAAADNPTFRLNGNSSSTYSLTTLEGNGSSASSSRQINRALGIAFGGAGSTSTTLPFLGIANIFKYAGSTYKTALCELNNDKNGSGIVSRTVGLWSVTDAVTSVTLLLENGNNFSIGTTATIYGIL